MPCARGDLHLLPFNPLVLMDLTAQVRRVLEEGTATRTPFEVRMTSLSAAGVRPTATTSGRSPPEALGSINVYQPTDAGCAPPPRAPG